jgi:hypothetical protein
MTDERDQQPDYSELLRSPYDPEPGSGSEPDGAREGEGDLPWVPAVIAAIAGALVVSAFVVLSIVTEPEVADDQTATTSTTTAMATPVQSDQLPEGFTSLTPEVGAQVEDVTVSARGTFVAVSTAVPGGTDPAEVPPIEVAYWELESDGVPNVMTEQYGELGILGNITIVFPSLPQMRQPELRAYVAEGADEQSLTIDLPDDFALPATYAGITIDMGDGRSVQITELTIGEGWGYVSWVTEGDFPTKLETVVTFVGTDDPATEDVVDPTRLTSPHLRTIGQGTGPRPVPGMYGFSGSSQLVRSGEPLGESNAPSALTVEFRAVMPAAIAEPVPVDLRFAG